MEIQTLITRLNDQTYDNHRNAILTTTSFGKKLTGPNIISILNTYTYDNHRIDCLKIVKHKLNLNSNDIPAILGCFTYDNYRNTALECLFFCVHIQPIQWPSILNEYTYDNHKTDAIKKLNLSNFHISDSQLEELRHCFTYANNFITMAKSLGFKDQDLEKYKQEEDDNKSIFFKNLTVAPGGTIVMGNSVTYTGISINGASGYSDLMASLFPGKKEVKDIPKKKEFPFEKNPIEATDEDESKICNICMVNLKDTLLTPCGHMICVTCAKKIWDKKQCPDCRDTFTDAHKAFI